MQFIFISFNSTSLHVTDFTPSYTHVLPMMRTYHRHQLHGHRLYLDMCHLLYPKLWLYNPKNLWRKNTVFIQFSRAIHLIPILDLIQTSICNRWSLQINVWHVISHVLITFTLKPLHFMISHDIWDALSDQIPAFILKISAADRQTALKKYCRFVYLLMLL